MIRWLIVVMALGVLPWAHAQDFVVDGLVSFWTFDQRHMDGNTLQDVWGTNHGEMADTEVVEGRINEALAFNGSSSLVSIADEPSLALTDAITVEAWVKLDVWQVAERHILFSKYDQNQTKRYFQFAVKPDVGISAFFGHSDGTAYVQAQSGAQTPEWINAWVHMAVTWDKDNDGLPRLYVDGEDIGQYESQQEWTDALSPNDLPWTIGAMPGFNRYLSGTIDELRVYDRRLSDEEIQANALVESNALAVEASGKLATVWACAKLEP